MRDSLYLFVFLSIFFVACSSEKTVEPTKTEEKVIEEKKPENETSSITQINETLGKFKPSQHDDFVKLDKKYADREGMYLRKEVYEQFVKMYEAAEKANVKLVVRSATRNFDAQKNIWEGKWTGRRLNEGKENLAETTPDHKERAQKILKWSSMPGSSRHHWGTDLDFNAFENSYFESGEGEKVYQWLVANASNYGFCQPYTKKDVNRPNGYNEEKWHWSYLPLAAKYLRVWKKQIKNEDIKDFLGAETAQEIDIKKNYVLGVNSSCK